MITDESTIDPARSREAAIEPYEPPTATVLGTIAELTAGGTVGPDDGAGFGELGGS